jgi:PST family polysaccharide transporter
LFQSAPAAPIFAVDLPLPALPRRGQVNDAVLKRDLRFRSRTGVDLTRAAVRVAVSIPLALTVGGAVSIAAGIVASELVAMVLLWLLVPIRPELRPDRRTVRALLGFGGQVTVIRILGSLRSNLDYVAVGACAGHHRFGVLRNRLQAARAGDRERPVDLLRNRAVGVRPGVRRRFSSPAGHDAEGDPAAHPVRVGRRDRPRRAGPRRDPVLFSPQWTPAIVPAALIALSLGVAAIPWASGDVFSAVGRPGTLILLDVPATVLMAVAFVFAPRWGLVGVALVHLIFNLGYCVARLAVLHAVTG